MGERGGTFTVQHLRVQLMYATILSRALLSSAQLSSPLWQYQRSGH
jgi:hypothetical protein